MTDLEQCAKRVGTTLRDKWKLERLLGVGGMAAVYVAAHKIGRRDAIKILHEEIAQSPEVRARFEQEAHAANRFKHPGAVEIRDIDVTEDGAPFLVMELLEGETLSRIVRREPGPTIDEVLRWADELLDVLAAAHAQGIVHRDIKPDNLFIQTDGRLKVLDFGIARVRSGAAGRMKTATGATIGTVAYMPPEQAKGGDIDGRADIFAVGATMYRLISKRKIHEAENDIELLKKMATEQAPPLASVAPSTPAEVCRVVDRALAFDREARYADATGMQAEVRAARAAIGPAPAPVSAQSPMAQSIEAPPSAVPMPPASAVAASEAPTVGPRRPSAPTDVDPAPPPMSKEPTSTRSAIPSVVATRQEATLRSGAPPEPTMATVPPSPPPPSHAIASAPPAVPIASAPAVPIASTPPALPMASTPPRPPLRMWLIIGGSIAAFVLVVVAGVVASTVWLVKTTPADGDAALDAGAESGVADDTEPPSPSASAASTSTHKTTTTGTTASPPKPAPAPLPPPKHGGGKGNK